MTGMRGWRSWLVVLGMLALPARADENRGIRLARQAQRSLASGNPARALEQATAARVEWPGSPEVAHTMADALFALGRHAEALEEYERGMEGPYRFRAHFNRGVTRSVMTESALSEAGVPADPAALPEPAPPGLLPAVEQGLERLDQARADFLQALDVRSDAAARESLAALNRRVDELEEMAERLREQAEQQDQKQDQNQDQKQQEEDGDSSQDQQPEGQPQEDQKPGEQPEDEPEPDEQNEDKPAPGQQQAQSQPRNLSPEEVQRLLQQLDELEQRARELEKARARQRRRAPEKDW